MATLRGASSQSESPLAPVAPAAEQYTPEVKAFLMSMVAQSQRETPGTLMAAVYHYMFGVPMVARSIVQYWFSVLEELRRRSPPPHHRTPDATIDTTGEEKESPAPRGLRRVLEIVARLLHFVSTAPAAPCIRSYQVGGEHHHVVHFLPFGCAKLPDGDRLIQPANLPIPIVHADPRIVHAVCLIINNNGGFTHKEEDPVYNHVTFSCFSNNQEAQGALDKYREIFVATAIRTLIESIRHELSLIPDTQSPSSSLDTSRGAFAPSYLGAKAEAICMDTVREALAPYLKKHTAAPPTMLDRCLDYILKDSRKGWSKPNPNPATTDRTYPYVVLPTDEEIQKKFGPRHPQYQQDT
jgi:hypothetical protein